ncbi:hypothetical protein EJM73_09085 [Clostridium botulinum]|uniref:hypothetical protein n=1 Tax=Clostridium botulinum TaxID=1491 RepID=UPI001375577E|nr:hypothetical protein [Clostridium botulinum]NCI19779.1 hypothetical protein [Clostridium botulinum]NCI35817.1 hypothetical protein [Clostridium botulinum]NCI71674.1 hypothetical protein [Clostridium botulinum]NDI38866.1 hypothetical protein [Clostridium botulinum]
MEILSQNINNKKAMKGVERCEKVYEGSKKYSIGNNSYITVSLLGKTWRVKKQAENKWLKVAKVEEVLKNNLNDLLGAISVAIAGILIYCLIAIYY